MNTNFGISVVYIYIYIYIYIIGEASTYVCTTNKFIYLATLFSMAVDES